MKNKTQVQDIFGSTTAPDSPTPDEKSEGKKIVEKKLTLIGSKGNNSILPVG